MRNNRLLLWALILILVPAASAQSTAFTYQGKLTDGGMSPTGQYDFVFRLFDAPSGGAQVGSDFPIGDVQVTAGIFTVNLNFGTSPFTSGADRHLEISVRPGVSTGTYTALTPLQALTSSPYSIKTLSATSADSLSAACVSCVSDANIDTVSAGKVSGVLSFFQGGTGIGGPTFPPAGGFLHSSGTGWEISGITAAEIPTNLGTYIQNTTTTQATSNFNVSGTGRANIFNANTQYNIGGNRVLSIAGTDNFFAGVGAGQANTSGLQNAFSGSGTGQINTTGSFNSFFGYRAGSANIDGAENSFFGYLAGVSNTSASINSFFGKFAGFSNTTGSANSFFGYNAGFSNTGGANNLFLGVTAGDTNATGNKNTIIGSGADVSASNLNYATAIGADSVVSSNDSVVLGRNLDTVRIPGNLNVAGTVTATISTANNALNLGGVAANQYVVTTDPRMTDARNPLPNSTNYIQNIPGIGTQSASFNINGGGTANILNASTQYNIGGDRVLSIAGPLGSNNLFVGLGSGQSNTGTENTFVGRDAGLTNNNSRSNSFFGNGAGQNHIDGSFNAFVGSGSGFANRGSENSFFGDQAGRINGTGSGNSFFGRFAGNANTFGSGNVFIGYLSNPLSNSLNNATAIGARAAVSQSDSLVLGSIANVNGAGSDTNVGIGTTAPQQVLHANGSTEILSTGSGAGFKFRDRGSTSTTDDWVWYSNGNIARLFEAGSGDLLTVQTNGNVGIGTPTPAFKLQITDSGNAGLRVQTNTAGGTVASFGAIGEFKIDAQFNPAGRLKVAESGRVYIPRTDGGLVLRSPNGTCWAISIADNGVFLPATAIPCP